MNVVARLRDFAKDNLYVFALLILALIFFHSIISSTNILENIHYINDVTFYSYNIKESLKHGALPLWTPYYYSGQPLFAQPEYYFIDFNFLLVLLTGNVYLAMNFSVIIYFFLAGLGMYFLVHFLLENKKAAFISAVIYMLNGFVHTFVVPGNIMVLEGYSLVPFVILFTIKALKGKDFVFNAVMAGIFMALLVFAGGTIFVPYLFVMILVYSLIYIIDKKISGKLLKLLIVCIIIGAAGFGIAAVKVLPGLEFVKMSNRGEGLPYQEYLGEPIQMKNFAYAFATTFWKGEHISAALGLIGFCLMLLGLFRLKNKTVLFCAAIVLLSLLMSTESFLAKALFKVPVFNQARHVERAIFLYAFAGSVLAGFGFLRAQEFFGSHKKTAKNVAFGILLLLIFLEMLILQNFPSSVKALGPNEIPILEYMGKDKDIFRTINLALSTPIGASGYNYYSQLGISEIKGGSGIWFNDYLTYVIIAGQTSPAKLWGLLNNKYVVMKNNDSIEGLKYIGKFRDCGNDCQIGEPWGPYLYENLEYLPRYYLVPNGIFIVGENAQVNQLSYSLLVNSLNQKNSVLISGTKIDDYDVDFIKKFKAVLLLEGSVTQGNTFKLREYAQAGGKIVPDIFTSQESATIEAINAVLANMSGAYKEMKILQYTNNKVALELNGEKGWLVVSERFAHFPGWEASINNKKIPILKADNAISAVYLDGEKGALVFEYKPASYKKGKLISLLATLILVSYFGYFVYSKKRKKGVEN